MRMQATKVPAMKKNQPYVDWRKEIQIWESTNQVLGVNKKVQAGKLFQSLEGLPRQTVLSQLKVVEIMADDGVKNIIDTLDNFLMGNATQNAYDALDQLMSY